MKSPSLGFKRSTIVCTKVDWCLSVFKFKVDGDYHDIHGDYCNDNENDNDDDNDENDDDV